MNAGSNFYFMTKKLSANSGVSFDFINDLAALGTLNFYSLFIHSRLQQLQNSTLIDIMAKDMRIKPKILLGLVALYHKEEGALAE